MADRRRGRRRILDESDRIERTRRLQLVEGAARGDRTVAHQRYRRARRTEELQLVRHEHSPPPAEMLADGAVEQLARDTWIDGGERVVDEERGGAAVEHAREADARALAARERDATFADLGGVARR